MVTDSVTMVTELVNLTCWLAGFLEQTLSFSLSPPAEPEAAVGLLFPGLTRSVLNQFICSLTSGEDSETPIRCAVVP